MQRIYQTYRKLYSNELLFLLDMLKSEKESSTPETTRHLPVNEKKLIPLVTRHKLIGYVYKQLSPKLSSETKESLTAQYKQHTRHTLTFIRQLILVSQKFDQNNIPYLAFKGPVLSQMLYGDPLVKHSVDLDFWVSLDNIENCEAILNDAGFIRVKPGKLTPRQRMKNYSINHHYTYVNQAERVVIELHWNITNPFSLLPLTFQDAYSSHTHVELHNHQIKTLSYVHYLLYLAVHGSIHRWSRLTWLKDFSALLSLSTENQQQQVFRIADEFQLTKPVKQAFWLSYVIFETPVSDEILKHHPIKPTFFYTDPVKSITKSTSRLNKEKLPGLIYKWHIRNNSKYRFSIFFRLRTHFTDWEIIKLPDQLFFLYYLLRPFFIVFRGVRSLLRRN